MNKGIFKRVLTGDLRPVVLFFTVILLLVMQANAQLAGTGSIQGSVADATGAVVQHASVVVTNTATQVKHTAETGSEGLYSFPNLDIGTYTVQVSAKGFKQYEQTNIVLEVGSSIAVNVGLSTGTSDQNVTVTANGLALQTEDASFKQTIDQKTLTEMPLNGRYLTQLITLSGGSASANENSDLAGSKTFYSSVPVSVAGGQGNTTDYRLDGGDFNDYMSNVNLPFPFPDAVAEFSVESTDLSAQNGLHPGGLVNVVTRSGSNKYHGSAFEFIRNNIIDASNFFSTRDTLHLNQFGGTLGGPIIKDKLFIFAGYQRTKYEYASGSTTAYVPTAANLRGDFSVTDGPLCASGGGGQLVNPQTGATLVGNQISTSYFNQQALNLQAYLPVTTDQNCGKVQYTLPIDYTENQFVTRADWTISAKNSMYARYLVDGYNLLAFYSPTNILLTANPGNVERVQSFTLGETYIVTPSLVNSFHATVDRRVDKRGPATSGGINANTIGVNIYTAVAAGLQVTATNKWGSYCGTCAAAHFNDNTFSFTDDVTWIHGKHQVGFGGEYVRSELNIYNVYEENGVFTFSGNYSKTGPTGTSPGTIADANLDFLTGSMSAFQQSKAQQNALRAPIPSLYVMDTYHATKRLVLTAGVRWDPEYFPTDYFGRGSVFSMSAFLANVHSAVYPNAPAGVFFYGDPGVRKNFTQNSPYQFSPRLALTFDPFGNGTTVVRAGAALVYDQPNFFTGQRVQQNPPFAQAISNTPSSTGPLSFTNPWAGGSAGGVNPFPEPAPSASSTFLNGTQYIVLPTKFRPAYSLQWTASIQQQFGRGWQMQLDYVGNKTSELPYGFPIDPAVYAPGATTSTYNTHFALTEANSSQGPLFAGGGSGSLIIATGANATYNGLIATLQHRVSSNFVFLANYTWSKCIDIEDDPGDIAGTTVQNPANIKGDRASCGFDFTNIFNLTLVATSHFGLHGWESAVLNHWEIAPLIHASDGIPFTVTTGVDRSITDINNDRPNLTNPAILYTHQAIRTGAGANAQYINKAAFTQNAIGTFGTSGRNAYRGLKQFQADASLSRIFPIHRTLALDLRLEGFNVLNHPNFAAPNSTSGYEGTSASIASSSFGQISSTVTGTAGQPRQFQGALKLTF